MATEKASQNSEMDSTVTGGLQKLNVTGISSKQEEDDEYPDWVIPSTPEDLQEKKIVFPSKLTLCSRSRLLLFMTDSCLTGGVMSYIHVTSFSSNAAVHLHSKMCPGNCCCHRLKTAVFFSCTHMTELAEWRSGSVSALPCERPGFASRTRLREIIPANNCTMQGQNNWGNWGSPGVMKL